MISLASFIIPHSSTLYKSEYSCLFFFLLLKCIAFYVASEPSQVFLGKLYLSLSLGKFDYNFQTQLFLTSLG